MTEIRLDGCRSDSLLGYLKALAMLRLLTVQQGEAVRGRWRGVAFAIESSLSQEELEDFFVSRYSPTPILNPWNSGAGFDHKSDKAGATLDRVAATTHPRWAPYRSALEFVRSRYVTDDTRTRFLEDKNKTGFIRDLRSRCPDAMLEWLDAAVVLTPEKASFPFILGSGGNDGRLDFSINFAARALDVCGDEPMSSTSALLRDCLMDTETARLVADAAIGQFSPRHAGGPNATTGFDAASLVNPWDYVLMLEGAVLFSGSIRQRTQSSRGSATFPFALNATAAGFGSASAEEATRGEMWLPVWDGLASLASVRDLIRKGRMDIPVDDMHTSARGAANASEAAAAVVTMGVGLGLSRLERVAFAQRNGLAFSAAAVGSIAVSNGYDDGIAVLSRRLSAWIDALRRKTLGAAGCEALRTFDERLIAFASLPPNKALKARARQELLVAIANLSRATARAGTEMSEPPWIDSEVLQTTDDGTVTHRTASAAVSLGGTTHQRETRKHLLQAGDDATHTLRSMIERHMRNDERDPSAGWLKATSTLSADDAIEFLALAEAERRRFNDLLRAYALVRRPSGSIWASARDWVAIPAAYALLKVVFDNRASRDDRIVRLLFAEDVRRALAIAVRRARAIRDLPYGPRDVSTVALVDAPWTAAALVLPIGHSFSNYGRLLNAACTIRLDQKRQEDAAKFQGYIDALDSNYGKEPAL